MSQSLKSYLKSAVFFTPIFILLYNNGSNFYGYSPVLYSNPFADISGEQWIKESPIQFFIGYFINIVVKNPLTTHWIMISLGFIYLFISLFLFDRYCFNGKKISKILFFTPFFLIMFTWIGKPDTLTVGSLFYLIVFSGNIVLGFVFTLVLIFSHPQIAFIYFVLIKYLNLFKFKLPHFISVAIGYLIYFFYYSQLNDFQGRYGVISNELDRVFKTIFTNTLGGLISLFMWLWIIIFLSGIIKNKKFQLAFLLIFSISFFTLDHTRIFTMLAVPLVIYISNNKNFLETFENILDKKIMYFLGFFQIQKRADGRIVDGVNYYENQYFNELINLFLRLVEKF